MRKKSQTLMGEYVTKIVHETIKHMPKDSPFAHEIVLCLEDYISGKDKLSLKLMLGLKKYPVGVEEFLLGEYYLNLAGSVYPRVLHYCQEINTPDDRRISSPYYEAVFTGSIGSAKTTTALYTTAYQLYIMSCFRDPHKSYGLDPTSEILFIFQSLSAGKAKSIDYNRFRAMIERSPYFNIEFPFDKDLGSVLKFPHRVEVKPVSGESTATIGDNVFGGIIDEVNFMEIVSKSSKSIDGGVYDQASALYNSLSRRRKSRFMDQGVMPGILCLVSSKHYPGEFTERKAEEAETNAGIYIYDKRTWDVLPASTFIGRFFKVFVGDVFRQPRILESEAEYEAIPEDEKVLVMDVPVEYRTEFELDIMNALRDIAGVGTISKHPFLSNHKAITEAFCSKESVLNRDMANFQNIKLIINPANITHALSRRWVHVDLAISNDSAGVACGFIDKFVSVDRGDGIEMFPHIVIDFVLEIAPPVGGEIIVGDIRNLLYALRDKANLPIQWVTMDSFQSVDMLQAMRLKGFVTGLQSIDKTMQPYSVLKSCIYDRRIRIPRHKKLALELQTIEYIPKKGKVDHPAQYSKDLSDALAGVVYGLSMRTELWVEHGIPPVSIPKIFTEKSNMKGDKDAYKDKSNGGRR